MFTEQLLLSRQRTGLFFIRSAQPRTHLNRESHPREKRSKQPASKCMGLKKDDPTQTQLPNGCKAKQLLTEPFRNTGYGDDPQPVLQENFLKPAPEEAASPFSKGCFPELRGGPLSSPLSLLDFCVASSNQGVMDSACLGSPWFPVHITNSAPLHAQEGPGRPVNNKAFLHTLC